jgi:hypothetical protein
MRAAAALWGREQAALLAVRSGYGVARSDGVMPPVTSPESS